MPSPSVDRYVVVRYLERDGYVTMPISPRELVVVATALASVVLPRWRRWFAIPDVQTDWYVATT
jgi:hypothetical protein